MGLQDIWRIFVGRVGKIIMIYVPFIPKLQRFNNLLPFFGNEYPKLCFYSYARHAIFEAYSLFKERTGKTKILLPAYICEEAITAIPVSERIYYGIDEKMNFNLDDINSKINLEVGALLYVDYFGFVPNGISDLVQILKGAGIGSIEDAAHKVFTPFSTQEESCPDVSIYSLRKTYPLINGGILKINNPSWGLPTKEGYKKTGIFREFIKLLYYHCKFRYGWDLLKRIVRKDREVRKRMDDNMMEVDKRMSLLSHNYFMNMDRDNIEYVIERRRRNYLYLMGKMKSDVTVKAYFPVLLPDARPFGLPLKLEGGREVIKKLWDANIEAMLWTPNLPEGLDRDEFKEVFKLAETTVILPVQQDLTQAHLDLMVSVMRSLV